MAFTLRKRTSIQYKTRAYYNLDIPTSSIVHEDYLAQVVGGAMGEVDHVAHTIAELVLKLRRQGHPIEPGQESESEILH